MNVNWSQRTCCALCLLAAALTGCAAIHVAEHRPESTSGVALSAVSREAVAVSYVTIPAERYHEAFDAAGEVARRYGLVPALRDRRSGIIETEPGIARSIFEPPHRATRTLEQALASTFSFQRRRARFEFQPAGFRPSESVGEPGELTGPGLIAETPAFDLTAMDLRGQNIELRVWVYNERAHIPGIRRSSWSRRLTTRTAVIDPQTGYALEPAWTVVARERALEEHLLAQVGRRLWP